MDHQTHNQIANFIWNIADDYLRDIYRRGEYRNVILPMTVIRRLDAVLEPTKEKVLAAKKNFDKAGLKNQDAALGSVAGQAFCNSSPFNLRDLTARTSKAQLKADFTAYLDGFSPNVQEIIEKFGFRNQIQKMLDAGILGAVIEKFVSPQIIANLVVKFEETEQSKIFDHKEFGYWKTTVYRPKRNEKGAIEKDKKGNPVIDSDLTDSEQIPFNYPGGVPAFFEMEVKPYTPDAWYEEKETKIGYEISFTKYFYKPVELRPLEAITADIRALEKETKGLLERIIGE